MNAAHNRNSLICPHCRRLISRSSSVCPNCGLKNPTSLWKNNIFTRTVQTPGGVLKMILAANIAMFIFSVIIDPRSSAFSASPFNFLSPSNDSLYVLSSTGTVPLFYYHRWWSLIAASFLHGGLMHIAFNMIALYQIGPLLIREYGTDRMIIIYTMSGIGGYLISSLFGIHFTIGASAAICGLIGAVLYYGKSRGGTYGNAIFSQVGGWVVGIFIFGFLFPGINNWGHAGGMLTGAITGYLLGYRERKPETVAQKRLSWACIIVTGMVLLWSILNGLLFIYIRMAH